MQPSAAAGFHDKILTAMRMHVHSGVRGGCVGVCRVLVQEHRARAMNPPTMKFLHDVTPEE